jgi:pimeloyl-ACP methyl ester carboxylesterase
MCGILAPVLYIAMSLFIGLLWEGYSVTAQTISELSAIGAPTRPLWMLLGTIYTAMMIAFGWGVWKTADRNEPLRVVGALLIAQGVFGFFWPPMHQRVVLAAGGGTLTDTLHIVWTIVTSLCFMVALGFGAAAFGKRFRVYSIATMVIVFGSGAWTGTYASAMQANLPTPWAGVWERIDTTMFMLWIAVLATALLRAPNVAAKSERRGTSSTRSAFKSPEGEAAFLAAYDAVMKLWPVPYEELEVPSRFGTTHVIVSGPREASPLVLIHGYDATSTMWAPNVADFSNDYRVYALDVMGQPSKSIPAEPIRNAEDYAVWLAETLDGLHLDRVFLIGQSYGAWLALNFAMAAPGRVQKLVLLSPGGGFMPLTRQFGLRGMLMMLFPARVMVNWFMRWLGITSTVAQPVLELMHLGLKHFRVPAETLRVMPVVFSDDRLRAMRVPTLLLIGDHEVICDPATALARARRLFPNVQGELVPECSHDMCFSRREIVDARVLDFLKQTRTGDRGAMTERSVA